MSVQLQPCLNQPVLLITTKLPKSYRGGPRGPGGGWVTGGGLLMGEGVNDLFWSVPISLETR